MSPSIGPFWSNILDYDFGPCSHEVRAAIAQPPPNALALFPVEQNQTCEGRHCVAQFTIANNNSVMIRMRCATCDSTRRGWWNGDWAPVSDFQRGGYFENAVPREVLKTGLLSSFDLNSRDEFTKSVRELFKEYDAQPEAICFLCGERSAMSSMKGLELDHVVPLHLQNRARLSLPRKLDPRVSYRMRREVGVPGHVVCNRGRNDEPLESITDLRGRIRDYWSLVGPASVGTYLRALEQTYAFAVEADRMRQLRTA